jgi:hypothetical protein
MKTDGWSDNRFETWLKITKDNNWKLIQGMLSFFCAAFLINKINPPMKFQVDILKTFWVMLLSGEKLGMENNKGQ